MRNMKFSSVNIKMLLAVVDMQHSLHVLIMAVNRATDHLCVFFLYDSLAIAYVYFFYNFYLD